MHTREDFGPLANLIGLWSGHHGINTIALPDGTVHGGGDPPVPAGIAFKANTYNEMVLQFKELGGPVPNRAVPDAQRVHALEYEQRISQVEGPAPTGLQHVENGLWMWTEPQHSVARSTSVPHGNAFLCWGGVTVTHDERPDIPDPDFTPDVGPHPSAELQNFLVQWSEPISFPGPPPVNTGVTPAHLNQALIHMVDEQLASGHTFLEVVKLEVSTVNSAPPHPGGVANTAFILENGNATAVQSTFWIEKVRARHGREFLQLQYSQNISLTFDGIIWPHVDVNTLVKHVRE
ncbi:MAG: heme-binding protein [Acidimicrobiales bacterium]